MSSPDEQDFPGHLLHQAALWDNADLLLDLLNGELISLINSQDSWGRTPLHAAATTDSSKCLEILLKAGANPNVASGAQDNFKTPLHVSSEHGFMDNVRRLVEHGADSFVTEGHGWTPIDLAERGGHNSCHEFLRNTATSKEETRENLHHNLRDYATNGDITAISHLFKDLGPVEVQSIINMTPNGTNTLLFKACESGNKSLVQILLDNGADGRIHPVTKYSPLYIAAYYGHKEIVSILLKTFPLLVKVPTVEKWLPLHACCINGHVGILEMLLKFDYCSSHLRTFHDSASGLDYDMPFDINLKDVSDQNALYIACQMGNQRLVDMLLKFRVEGRKPGENPVLTETCKSTPVQSPTHDPSTPTDGKIQSPSKKRISEGIQGILSKLSLVTNQNLMAAPPKKSDNLICPVDVNAYCEEHQTPLHVAVKQKHHVIAANLLLTKADPNLAILPVQTSNMSNSPYDERRSSDQRTGECSSALVEACMQRDLGMIELLLKHGARDDDCKALAIVLRDDVIAGKILSLKAHLDAENKVNTVYLTDTILKRQKKTLLASSIVPTSAVTINWHSQRLDRILEQWLVSAALKINPRLRLCPRNQHLTLHAITRLDLSANALEKIPPMFFNLCSLKYLNLSQNKIQQVEFPEEIVVPCLEEMLLHENRIDCIPEEIFTCFPSLLALNLSNNKIQNMPPCMWSSPHLQELNLSLNLLSDLPPLQASATADSESTLESINISQFTSPVIPILSPTSEPTSPDFVMVDFEKNRDKFCMDKNLQQLSNISGRSNASTVLLHHGLWRNSIKVLSSSESTEKSELGIHESALVSLNLSHNSFNKVPKVLSCLGTNLQRVNLSFNNLKCIGFITDYPTSIRQLDLSNNRISKWIYSHSEKTPSRYSCFNGKVNDDPNFPETSCPHKRHTRLENLKTLVLSGNLFKTICVSADDYIETVHDVGVEQKKSFSTRNLWYPNITMLDISDNQLKEITSRISELTNLSVLNLSGNADVTDLPPEMGLLSRMWNLNTTRCNLQEPLKSMIESKRCKTMDVVGYLKSVLEDAKTYSRMKLMVVGIQGIGKTSLLGQLRQEGSQKHVHQDHWAKRMGAARKSSNPKGKPISTVGVDIGSWVLDHRGNRNSTSAYGPVIFRTWDFGGQKEYYATHLYFLSRRSLYLVVWNICDGEKGLNEIIQWLVNIQARAPNSPVIIVGTHFDLVSEKFPPGYLDYLQQKIRDKFICISDPEKRGLPRVVYSVEVSCRTRHNIKHLCNLIYETVFNIKTSNGKRLLEQKIPSKYIHLEEIVAYCATERKSRGLDPVLTEHEFKSQVSGWLDKGFGLTFRDDAEIMQACSFLHENGVLLHYEDSTLRDLYFLDSQWLCDMLAHVVTVKEINPFAKYGIMKVEDLKHLFKGQSNETRDYVLSLLSKFELAVPWDHVHLLIPSLLPSFEQMKIGQNEVRVKIPVRSRGWMLKNRRSRMSRQFSEDNIKDATDISSNNIGGITTPMLEHLSEDAKQRPQYIIQKGNVSSLNRFLLLSYFPSGFWPRLISRILADDRIVEIVRNYFNVPPPSEITSEVVELLDHKAEWCCWQSGMELTYGDLMLMRVKEVTGEKPFSFMLRRDDGALCESEIIDKNSSSNNEHSLFREDDSEQIWDAVDLNETGLLEIHLPAFSVLVSSLDLDQNSYAGIEPTSQFKNSLLEPSVESLAKLLALIVDHVDTLLEDWYPSIGTRFVHTSEGKYLVTRLIPCPKCFPFEEIRSHSTKDVRNHDHNLSNHSPNRHSSGSSKSNEYSSKFPFSFTNSKSPRMSSDSGVGYSPSNTRVSSVDSNSDPKDNNGTDESTFQVSNSALKIRAGVLSQTDSGKFNAAGGDATNFSGLNFFLKGSPGLTGFAKNVSMYSWSVEYCILHSQKYAEHQCATFSVSGQSRKESQANEERQLSVKCPKHGDVLLKEICPDVLFLDLNSRYLLQNPCVQRGNLLGRGAFGFVFSGKLVPKYESKVLEIAIKMFQPIDPGHDNTEAQAAYKIAKSKWFRAPAQSACRAYVAARGEVRVLYWVSHPNIVPFVGLCQSPLSIVMPRAPKGALDSVLSDYRRSGDKVSSETLRVTVLQVGKALEYLHSHRIIYRDLKSENVLVWSFPPAFAKFEDRSKVDVKLADYGISRSSFPTGSKGFGGTEGFMAPEIIRYNGEEEYTEKFTVVPPDALFLQGAHRAGWTLNCRNRCEPSEEINAKSYYLFNGEILNLRPAKSIAVECGKEVDIFSFGMLLYEVVSLKQPFDGCENVKESILEGVRPCLTRRDCELYPLYILDLMVVCWSHVAKDRPTASQVVTITTGPEFTFLRDVVSLANVTNVVSAIGLQYGVDKEIWASCSTGGIYCLKLKSCTSFESCLCFEFISGVVTAMCHVEDTVWMGDTLGKIHVLRISDYNKIVESDLESQVGYCGAIVSIQNLDPVVAVAVTTGRLFLCDKQNVQLLTELGKSTVIHCLNSRFIPDGTIELWAGERAGQMTIFTIRDGTVVSQEIINHYEPIIEAVEVLLIDAHIENDSLFSYVYPGSVIYGWDCDKREMVARLDVGKLLPVRESMEEELNNKPLQITVLKSTISEVYIGTNWGFVFVADVKYLRPITSFRPFTEDVRSFWIFRQMQTFSTMLNLASVASNMDCTNNASDGEVDSASVSSVNSRKGSSKFVDNSSIQEISTCVAKDTSTKIANESRDDSPTPGVGSSLKNSGSISTNAQLVVGIGKGFSHLIKKNIWYGSAGKTAAKQKRRAFALLWHVKNAWE